MRRREGERVRRRAGERVVEAEPQTTLTIGLSLRFVSGKRISFNSVPESIHRFGPALSLIQSNPGQHSARLNAFPDNAQLDIFVFLN